MCLLVHVHINLKHMNNIYVFQIMLFIFYLKSYAIIVEYKLQPITIVHCSATIKGCTQGLTYVGHKVYRFM